MRRSLLADPQGRSAEMLEHLASCSDCQRYADHIARFESRLERALRVSVPAPADIRSATVVPLRGGSTPAAPPRSLASRKGWLAMAATVLLAFVVAGALWLASPRTSLAADVVTHMAGEPDAWRRTDVAVPTPELQQVLRDAHVRLGRDAGMISYASSCAFRGHHVPHLVLQTDAGPVTVMVLSHESVSKPIQFDEQGYRGVIIPVQRHGSLAVLTKGPTTDLAAVQRVAAQVRDSIAWTD